MKTNLISMLREPHPTSFPVADCSVPVVFFGNFELANSATIGINPSATEFLDKLGSPIANDRKRFVDREVLGVGNQDFLTEEQAEQVYASQLNYFSPNANPYKKWFDVLERHLSVFGVSYYDGSLVHLDLTPWATYPVWKHLEKSQKAILLEQGLPLLLKILNLNRFKCVFLNGRQVMQIFEKKVGSLKTIGKVSSGIVSCEIKAGLIGNTTVLGWSANLQSSHGVSEELKLKIREQIQPLCDISISA